MINFMLWQQSVLTEYHTTKDRAVREESVPCKERQQRPNDWQRQKALPITAQQASLNSAVHECSGQYDHCFIHLWQAISALTMAKLKADTFNYSQIHQLIKDPESINSMNEVEPEALKTSVLLVNNFPGITNSGNYAELLNNTRFALINLDCNTIIKIHYSFQPMNRFPENPGSVSDEQ